MNRHAVRARAWGSRRPQITGTRRRPGEARAAAAALALWAAALGCASPDPPPPLPDVYSTRPSERLPIDGLWKVEREEVAADRTDPELWEGADGPRVVQVERGRMYLQSGLGPDERHGVLVLSDIHQSSATEFRCRRPLRDDDRIVWRRCRITLLPGPVLRVATPGSRDTLEFTPLVLADRTWFDAQAAAIYILSAREAHRPAPEIPVIAPEVTVPALPPPPEKAAPRIEVAKPASRFGRYQALVVGNDDYTYLPSVATAREDAKAVSRLLRSRYGFEVTLLRNPSRSALLGALDRYQRDLSKQDNFLLYWAGHGAISDEVGRCYWIPVEAMGDDPTEGLANDDLAATLRNMRAKHVIVVADSCFTAADRREIGLEADGPSARQKLSKRRARVVLSSGGLEPIQDGEGGSHSVFTGAFLDALTENAGVLDGSSLFERIQERVTGASQTPEYADIRDADHGGGDFLFVPSP